MARTHRAGLLRCAAADRLPSESPGDAESEGDQMVLRRFPLTPRSAQRVGSIVEGRAAHDAKAAISTGPRGAVSRVARVLLVPAILGPFPNVTVHVVEAPGISEKAIHRDS